MGRSLGEEAAKLGADLVLVSRTQKRLDKMAEVVRSHGRRALVVPTDINDEEACENPEDIAEIPAVVGSEESVKQKVIDAHRVLMGISVENRDRFRDLMTVLERG